MDAAVWRPDEASQDRKTNVVCPSHTIQFTRLYNILLYIMSIVCIDDIIIYVAYL